jgi:hypothetical protein
MSGHKEGRILHAQVNGEDRNVSLEGIDTIGDLLQQLALYVPPRDVIVSLRINGNDCGDDAAAELRELPVLGVEEVELRTCSPETFVGDASHRLEDYRAMVRAKFERAIECFDRGIDADGLDCYRRGIEELRLLVMLWDRLASLDQQATLPGDAVKAELQEVCDRLLTAQDRNDLATVRTVLADRLIPILEQR